MQRTLRASLLCLSTFTCLGGCVMRREPIAADREIRLRELHIDAEPHWPDRADPAPLAWRSVSDGPVLQSLGEANDTRIVLQARAVGPALVDFISFVKADRLGTPDEIRSTSIFRAHVFTNQGLEAAREDRKAGMEKPSDPKEVLVEHARASISLLLRRPPGGIKAAKGAVIFLHGMGGRKYATPVADRFVEAGWVVLESQGGSFRTFDGSDPESTDGNATSPEVTDDLLRSIGETGARASEFIGDMAHAVRGVWTLVTEAHPDLAGRPVVIVGCSFGAICTPTLAAMLPDAPEAMVLIGGGADVYAIAAESSYINMQLSSAGGGRRFTHDEVRRISEAYRPLATSDPYQTAPRVAHLPALMLHARGDTIVPAIYGDLLWERLGRPERWSWWYGHELLFYFLPDHSDKIVAWVERTVFPEQAAP